MKIWAGYDSEHSYSLVMIGYFTEESTAQQTAQKLETLRATAQGDVTQHGWDLGSRLSKHVHKTLAELELYDLNRSEVEQFGYYHTLRVAGPEIRITTEEGRVQGFLKVLIDAGAKIEVYSNHHWKDDGTPQNQPTPEKNDDRER